MSPAEKQAREEQADRKSGDAAGKRYNALSSVAPSKDPRDDVRGQKGYKKGGMVKKRRFEDGGEIDEMEMANSLGESKAIADEAESAGIRVRGQAMLEEMRDNPAKRKTAKPAAKSLVKKSASASDTGDEVARLVSRFREPVASKKPTYETSYDRMNRQNREASATRRSAADEERSKLAKNIREGRSGKVNPKTLMPEGGMKNGGSVSSRGDGIAQRGKTKGKMC